MVGHSKGKVPLDYYFGISLSVSCCGEMVLFERKIVSVAIFEGRKGIAVNFAH